MRNLANFSLFLFTVLIFGSCSKNYDPNIVRGSTYLLKTGHPQVRATAIGLFDQNGNPGINVTADIVYGSLIYKTIQGTHVAHINTTIQVINKKSKNSQGVTKSYNFTITKKNKDITHSDNIFIFQKRIPVEPGDYTVHVVVTDNNSKKQTVRTINTLIPNPNSNEVNLTNVQLSAIGVDNIYPPAYFPVTTYDVPSQYDTLKFQFQVLKPSSINQLNVNMKLIRFQSDTLPARKIFATNPTPTTLRYQGIDYKNTKVVQTQNRIITPVEKGSILIQYQTVRPKRGNYRFEVTLSGKDISKNKLYKAREFSVKSEDYPNVKTAYELAAPLYYLMDKKHYRKLMSIHNTDSLKNATNNFWMSKIGNKSIAQKVSNLYYQRVVEANKQFSNYKEGWKTDPGMVYILFGPPWYVDRSLDQMEWSYGHDHYDPNWSYSFTEYRIPNRFYPFHNYILRRRNNYFNVNYRIVKHWLSGAVLTQELY